MTQGTNRIKTADDIALEKLKDILLRNDRKELDEIRSILNDQNKLAEKVNPILREHFQFLKDNFSSDYETIINDLVDKKLKQSEKELLDLIYPSLGKMISKYVTLQMSSLKESIEESVKSSFSFTRSFTSFFTGVKESELIIKDAVVSTIEEVYVIQRDSGLLIGSASKNNSMDDEVIAGMLTAIKSFVEDAFNTESQDLEVIEYGSYKLVIRSYYSFYIAMAISGAMSTNEQVEVQERIDTFASYKMKLFKGRFDSSKYEISKQLEQDFIDL